jgi:catechol 2,3-dioxygenase-like lactoylglutathione lyase family enzyme
MTSMKITTLGFRRLDHSSMTVRNMDSAVRFYTEVLGAKVLYQMGPFDSREIPKQPDGSDWTDAHVNVPDAKLKITMLALGNDAKLELFEYARPSSAREMPPRNSDIGAAHLCLEVGDIKQAVDHLTAHGCQAMAGPITMNDGPCPASHSWYVKDPFGNQLELVEYLAGA